MIFKRLGFSKESRRGWHSRPRKNMCKYMVYLWYMCLTVSAGLARKTMDIRKELLKCEIMDNLILNLRVNVSGLGLVESEEIN